MTDYVRSSSTFFGDKDSLPSGNANKVIKGSEFDTEFNDIATAVNSKYDATDRNVANGIAGLDSGGLVASAQLPNASTTAIGAVERATDAESSTGTDTTRYITPNHLRRAFELGQFTIGATSRPNANIANLDVNGTCALPAAATAGGNRVLTVADEGSGNLLDADTLDGQHGSYYQNATNINAGTLANARLDGAVALHTQKNAWTAGEYTAEQNVTATASTTIDADLGNVFDISLGTNITTLTLSNMDNGQQVILIIRQQGSNTIAWPTAWYWAYGNEPTVTTGAGAVDMVVLTMINNTVYATVAQEFTT